jgi:hypothetical protein
MSVLLQFINIVVLPLWLGFGCISLIHVKIPPFFGYFVTSVMEYCCLIQPADSFSTLELRLISASITLVATGPAFYCAVLTTIYEVLLGLLSLQHFLETLKGHKCKRNGNYENIMSYKELSILINNFNTVYQSRFTLRVMGLAHILSVALGYFVIKMHTSLPILVTAALSIITVLIFIVISLIFSLGSNVYKNSNAVIFLWKSWQMESEVSRSRNHIFRKVLASIRSVRVKIGEANFVGSLTPIIAVSFCIEQVATLLLVK